MMLQGDGTLGKEMSSSGLSAWFPALARSAQRIGEHLRHCDGPQTETVVAKTTSTDCNGYGCQKVRATRRRSTGEGMGNESSALRVALRSRGGAAPLKVAGSAVDSPLKEVGKGTKVPRLPLRFGGEEGVPKTARGGCVGKNPRSHRSAKTPRSCRDVATGHWPRRASLTAAVPTPQRRGATWLDEFIHRGTPRPTTSSSVGACDHGLSESRFKQQIASWCKARGMSSSVTRPLSFTVGEDMSEGNETLPQGAEVSLLFAGIEVNARLVLARSPVATGPAFASAQTLCAWPTARQAVSRAAEVAAAGSLEDFLDALWSNGMPWGAADTCKPPVVEEDSSGSCSEASACESSGSPSSQRSISPKQKLRVSIETHAEGKHLPPSSFATWLLERPSLWRFEHAAGGLAWDYPQSKAEKRELLVLHFMAEEQQHKPKAAFGPRMSCLSVRAR